MASVKTISLYVLLALFIAAASGGIALLITQSRSGSPSIEILLPTATPTPQLKVYISGAVAEPGVYLMKEGDRLVDAIAAAEGITEDAQLSCINLATRVKDEAHYHVPGSGEPCQAASTTSPAAGEDGRTDLNTATAKQLQTLPGIGPVKAQAIVDYRETVVLFRSTQEIMEVKGIGPATYEKIRDLVWVGGVSP